MSSSKDTQRSQRRRELDARRSKSRVRLGSGQQSWGQLKEKLGFSLHSELAQHLLESYASRVCIKCSGDGKGETSTLSTTKESLQELILLVHNHGQTCPLPPVLHSGTVKKTTERDQSSHVAGRRETESKDSSEVDVCLKYTCENGHHFLWSPLKKIMTSKNQGDRTAFSPKRLKQRGRRRLKEPDTDIERQEVVTGLKTRQQQQENAEVTTNDTEQKHKTRSEMFRENKNAGVTMTPGIQEGNYVAVEFLHSDHGSAADSDELTGDGPARVSIENQSPTDINEDVAVLNLTNRGTQSKADPPETHNANKKAGTLKGPQLLKDDVSQIGGKRKRKSTSKVILPCEFEGCDKIFSSLQYLNHHVKYQHLQQKTFICSHPTCSKSFDFKKHLKEHEKLHSNQRDYICEFCAQAFRTSSNLIIHCRIHTGEKPLQCEVCGFTCRQKASLNWHVRKHNAESTYQFPCEICGRRFEKRDNVTAHCSKSHPDYNTPTPELTLPLPLSDPLPHPSGHSGSSPSASKNHTAVE
ncbi:zinc finger protein 692-like [Sinocyclocheilus rhinocerous]|uniref:zinc finger protein 692-like n=1 Tax=Sinocyclocheilus rhinocerous TaxID=307959 RepID=UPI0007B96512|nr:PREDICTED: zinc finger protein 692-like [Sinocyclocheilus rhinocerous]XP_016379816.1 PREDICTED: zinc finger protein 692-like [Sinocyclocheilus rhinocerous]